MAKSLRSKRRRKMRAEKRIVNAKKELTRLKKIAAKLHGKGTQLTKEHIESNIPDVEVTEDPDAVMQVDDGSSSDTEGQSRISKKELLRVNPQWMNQRKIKAIKSKIKRHNKRKSHRGSAAGLSSRKAKRSIKK